MYESLSTADAANLVLALMRKGDAADYRAMRDRMRSRTHVSFWKFCQGDTLLMKVRPLAFSWALAVRGVEGDVSDFNIMRVMEHERGFRDAAFVRNLRVLRAAETF